MMVKRSIFIVLVCVLAVAGLSAVAVSAPSVKQEDSSKTRVGTFRRMDLLVAFYDSTIWSDNLRDMMTEQKKAKTEGNEAKVKDLESKGTSLQENAHRQIAGEATLTNILEHLEKAMPALAKEANVQVIVEEPLFHDASVELVDITDLLVKQFTPVQKKGK